MRRAGQERQEQEKQLNMTFCVLSALAIVMVVAGHLGYNIMTVGDLFPYYSFHVPLFMFISGYFYREEEGRHPFSYVKKKVRRLIVPYLVWNLFYGVTAWAMRGAGFAMGEEISLRTLFVDPFLHGHQFAYNKASWFVPTLFIVEIINMWSRWILERIFPQTGKKAAGDAKEHQIADWIMLIGSLLAGILIVRLSIGGHLWKPYRRLIGRVLFLFPGFQMGQFYFKKLEDKDTLGNIPYFAVVTGIQVVLNICCNGLAFGAVWCNSFSNGPLVPYITTVTGIAFWLRVAKIAAPAVADNRAVRYLGTNTYMVMMHHLMVFMLLKMVIAYAAAHTGLCADFSSDSFRTDIYYVYLVRSAEHFKMVYLAAGVAAPLLLQYGIERAKTRIWLPASRR